MPSTRSDNAARWAAIAIGFSVPVSVAADNILMPLVFLLWILGGNFREKFRIIRENPVALSALGLLGCLAMGMFYGNAPFHKALDTLGKYIDLLFVPVFITLFRNEAARKWALKAFVASMLLTLFLSYMLKFGVLHQSAVFRGFAANPYVFKLHITQNFFMSYAAMILAAWAFDEKNGKRRFVSGILALAALFNVLFMVQGRIGYVVLALLLLYLFLQKFGKKGLIFGMLATLLLGSAAYYGSNEFHQRISVAAEEFIHWHRGQATKDSDSIGQRLEYDVNTLGIVREHPFFGVGTGGFQGAYAAEVEHTGMLPTHHPHNEFLLIAAQTGLIGLILLLNLFRVEWREAGRLPANESLLARGLVIAMASGCLFNSFLLDHAEGLFFAFMTGVLFSGRPE